MLQSWMSKSFVVFFPCNRYVSYLCLVKLPPWWLFISRKFGFVSQAVPCCVFVTSLSCSLSCFAFVLSALVLSLSLNLQKKMLRLSGIGQCSTTKKPTQCWNRPSVKKKHAKQKKEPKKTQVSWLTLRQRVSHQQHLNPKNLAYQPPRRR